MALLLQLRYDLVVHSQRDLRFLYQFVGIGEVEIFFDGMAKEEQVFFLVLAGGFDSIVEEAVDLGRQFIGQRVEGVGKAGGGVVAFQFLADLE